MDAVDLGILREMMGQSGFLFNGTDPRRSAAQIARKIGVDPTTVRARIRGWETTGFLAGVHVLPEPGILGLTMYAGGLHVPDPRARTHVLEGFGLLDGAVNCLEHVGGWLGVCFVADNDAVVERRRSLLARLPGVEDVQPFFKASGPAATRAPTPLEWRILRALRDDPRATAQALAGAVGVSTTTFHARYAALVAARAIASVPALDFTKFVGGAPARAVITIGADAVDAEAGRLMRDLEQTFVRPLALQAPVGLAQGGVRVLDVLLPLSSVAESDDVLRWLLQRAHVADAEVLFPRRHYVFPQWMDERLALAIAGSSPKATA